MPELLKGFLSRDGDANRSSSSVLPAQTHRGGSSMSDGVRLRGRAGPGRARLGQAGRPVRTALQPKQSETKGSVIPNLLASFY